MRAGLSTIQQTLTPDAAAILNQSIAEAGRRNHGQTTPLHVAATLLCSPSGYLRQACIKSHPNSSHPLQCRALELCFRVALERLPAAQNVGSGSEPPISNALMAALKRAQAHQRRGCAEQQQQPLLAVKVELEQLIISILDDPSVSRVMREASFSSPAVKATIEQSSIINSGSIANSNSIGLGFRAPPIGANRNPNLYLNPRLQQISTAQQSGPHQRIEEVKRVVDIFSRSKKRNPVLVGESEPELVMKELVRRVESQEFAILKDVHMIHFEIGLDKDQLTARIKELGNLIESKRANSDTGVILNLGDLKWLVEQPHGTTPQQRQQMVNDAGKTSVTEIGQLLVRFAGSRVWLISTATCETYLRCQVYHPSMENDWDLQAMPITTRAPPPSMFPRLATNGILSRSVKSLSPLKAFSPAPSRRLLENLDPTRRMHCCLQCTQNYDEELAKVTNKSEKSSFEVKSETSNPSLLPQWLQDAKTQDGCSKIEDQKLILKHKILELQKKWSDTCLRLHPGFHQQSVGQPERIVPIPIALTGLYNPNLTSRQPFQLKFQQNKLSGESLQLNSNLAPICISEQLGTPSCSPVGTDLVLGRPKLTESTHQNLVDADSFKRLLKGMMEKVWWQLDAASTVATTVTRCKSGNGKRRGAGDMWLLFAGPDNVGKKKMASALSELICGTSPITVSLGSRRDDGEPNLSFRGKTALDRIVEAVRRNPFSVIVLSDIDEADMLVLGSLKHAMERGRLTDSHGREISLGNIIFILAANWLPDNLRFLSDGVSLDEKKITSLASGDWQLRLSLCRKTLKRRPHWLHDEDRATKTRKDLTFDLNETADDVDKADGSHNSSDLTVDHDEDHVPNTHPANSPASRELFGSVDEAIVFKPVDFNPIKLDVSSLIRKKFSAIIGDELSMEIPDDAVEKIASGVWLGETGIRDWIENVLGPSLHELKSRLGSMTDECLVVRLEPDNESGNRRVGDWLPSGIKVVVDGL